MKDGIHPEYEKAVVKCACGATFETRSTKKDFTGRQKLVDTGGRVDRFNRRYNLESK